MLLNWPTFVLQRRVNVPLERIERVLCAPQLFRDGCQLDIGTDGLRLHLESAFDVMFPPFGIEHVSWYAPATVRTRRGRRLVQLDIEINAWDMSSTEVLVRPHARHPYRWSGRRLRAYFRVAHMTADALTHFLREGATAPDTTPVPTKLARSVV